MAKEIDRMSFKELQDLEMKIKRAKSTAQEKTRTDLKQKVEAMVASAGFKLTDLFGGRGGKGRKVAAKYVNPDDASETWTGRGRKPNWLVDAVKKGAKIESFSV